MRKHTEDTVMFFGIIFYYVVLLSSFLWIVANMD